MAGQLLAREWVRPDIFVIDMLRWHPHHHREATLGTLTFSA